MPRPDPMPPIQEMRATHQTIPLSHQAWRPRRGVAQLQQMTVTQRMARTMQQRYETFIS